MPLQETRVRSLGGEDPLEEEMATHSSILAWRVPRTEEPGRLQSVGSRRVGRDLGLNNNKVFTRASVLGLLLLLLSRFSRVRLCATPEMAAHEALPSLGFSRQEHWRGLPFPSLKHESSGRGMEKAKWGPVLRLSHRHQQVITREHITSSWWKSMTQGLPWGPRV